MKNMENFREEIISMMEEIMYMCEDYDIEYTSAILSDIAGEGAGSFAFHNDIDCEDMPEDLVIMCDDLSDMIRQKFPIYVELKEFINEIVDSIL